MHCVNHPEAAVAGICTRCDQLLCAQCVQDRNGRTFCPKCAQFIDRRAASRPSQGVPVPPPAGTVYQAPAAGADVYQGPPPDDLYPGPLPGGDVYQGPAGDVYQGPAGDVYQGDVYQRDVYQGDVYQRDVYQGPTAGSVQAPPAESMSFFQFLFSFKGRVSVGAYWLKYQLPYWLIYGLLLYSDTGGLDLESMAEPGTMGLGFALLMAYPSLAISVKRLHDRGRSGWFLFISLIPFIGGLWLFFELAILGGTAGANQYGDEP